MHTEVPTTMNSLYESDAIVQTLSEKPTGSARDAEQVVIADPSDHDTRLRELAVGDYVVFEDPDPGMHVGECEFVISRWFLSPVKRLRIAADGEVRISLNAPLGWVHWGDIDEPHEHHQHAFADSAYDTWMSRAHHAGDDFPEEYERRGLSCEFCENPPGHEIHGD